MTSSHNTNWWRGCVMYQVYPRSYCDTNGDGIGDLRGIISKLDYIASLGAEAIWISPFFKSPMKDFGYDVSDYRDVDPLFGSLNDFQDLLKYAHELGLKILIDQVWSHTSDQHRWFCTSRMNRENHMADWYVWADPQPDGLPPNNWLSYFGGPAWTWDARRQQYYLHHFLSSQPSLNLHNPEVKQEIKNTAAFWLDMGVDGFRLDVAHTYIYDKQLRSNPARKEGEAWPTDVPRSNPMAYQKRIYSMNTPENVEFIEEIRSYVNKWDNRCLLAEAGGDDAEKEAASYVKTDKRFHMAYSFGLVGSKMTKTDIVNTVQRIEDLIEDGWLCWSTGNHDFKRAITRVNPHYQDKASLARYLMALGMSLRGSFCIYQGEELGLPQAELAFEDLVDPYDIMLYPEHMGRDGCRTPMPWMKTAPNAGFSNTTHKTWLPIPPEHVGLAADRQNSNEESVLNHYRHFIKWRQSLPAMKVGTFTFVTTSESVIAFTREAEGQKILCVFNTTDTPTSWKYTEGGTLTPFEDINHGIKVNHHLFHKEREFTLSPYGYGFYKLER
ncbi:MAG: alpha-glucosidase [Rhodospirillales bacterium]|nr:alpha-glucosidase [Rhodospirillales bacterium]